MGQQGGVCGVDGGDSTSSPTTESSVVATASLIVQGGVCGVDGGDSTSSPTTESSVVATASLIVLAAAFAVAYFN